jgi:hypothetical protein
MERKKPLPKDIPENPWVDDTGSLKDPKHHKEVNRLLTCNCSNCQPKALKQLELSYEDVFKTKPPEKALQAVVMLYEAYITKERHATWGKKPIEIADFLVDKDK